MASSSKMTFTEFNESFVHLGTPPKTIALRLVSMTIACVGIISNLTVVVVFVNHKKIRHKIPIVYIINQVSFFSRSCKILSL